MALFDDEDRRIARALGSLGYCNPFLPERLELERSVLGGAFVPMGEAWHKHADDPVASPNLPLLTAKAEALANAAREGLPPGGHGAGDADLVLYEGVVLYLLHSRYRAPFAALIGDQPEPAEAPGGRAGFYTDFLEDMHHYLSVTGMESPALKEPAHLFAGFYQLRRAFQHIFEHIIGASSATAKLRAAVWQSIFSHDMRQYRRELFRHMGDIVTLITGASGTGKELVARAIGLSRYIPFDSKTKTFSDDGAGAFHPVNLAALSPTLIESELFGHRRGAFTGAVEDRPGWFELCKPLGAVFLDEIGEIDAAIQVKLLRVLETRSFQRIGESELRPFQGKIIAATNRDIQADMAAGRIRPDFYYRLCSDVITTPSLQERLRDSPDELNDLLKFITRTIVGVEEAGKVAANVRAWIAQNLGPHYPWPGNVRELEQCVRNVLIHGAYHGPKRSTQSARDEFTAAVGEGRLTADELLQHYCSMIYADTGTYQEAAHRLGLDHRTVKSKIDPVLLQRYAPHRD